MRHRATGKGLTRPALRRIELHNPATVSGFYAAESAGHAALYR